MQMRFYEVVCYGSCPLSQRPLSPRIEIGLRLRVGIAAIGDSEAQLCATGQVYRDGKYSSPKCVIVNGRRERDQEITPGPADYAPCRSDIMSRHRRQPVYVMTRADSAKRRQAQMTVTPGLLGFTVVQK